MRSLVPCLSSYHTLLCILDRWRCKRLHEWCNVASGWSRHYLTTGRYGGTKALYREVIQCHIDAAVQSGMMWCDKIKSLQDSLTTRPVPCRWKTNLMVFLISTISEDGGGTRGKHSELSSQWRVSIISASPAPLTLIIPEKRKMIWNHSTKTTNPIAPNSQFDLQFLRILITGASHHLKWSCV